MNQHETAEPVQTEKPSLRSFLVAEAPAIAGLFSALIAYVFEDVLFADLNNYLLTILLFIWLFGTMMWCAFGVVRRADAVAVRLGEPYGTLVLTLSVIVIEVSLLAALRYWEQEYNLEGARAFLVVIASLAVFSSRTTPRPSLTRARPPSRRSCSPPSPSCSTSYSSSFRRCDTGPSSPSPNATGAMPGTRGFTTGLHTGRLPTTC
jgi:hypothetical protein